VLIDGHVHLWDTDRLPYPWLDEFTRLRRPYLPADLAGDLGDVRLDGLVHVQADCAPERALDEVDLVAGLDSPVPVLGIVAHADLGRGAAVAEHLAALTARPLVRGVRCSTQNDPDLLATAAYADGLVAVDRAGLSADLCVRAEHLPQALTTLRAVAERAPDLRVVLDHAGKPPVGGERADLDRWAADLAALATLPGVVCKLSGLVTEADWATWTEEQVLPVARTVLDVFGPGRVLFGGDWPVLTLAADYPRWYRLVERALAGCTPAEVEQVTAGTALRTYRLTVPAVA
jgi:L-fuconolactonase